MVLYHLSLTDEKQLFETFVFFAKRKVAFRQFHCVEFQFLVLHTLSMVTATRVQSVALTNGLDFIHDRVRRGVFFLFGRVFVLLRVVFLVVVD